MLFSRFHQSDILELICPKFYHLIYEPLNTADVRLILMVIILFPVIHFFIIGNSKTLSCKRMITIKLSSKEKRGILKIIWSAVLSRSSGLFRTAFLDRSVCDGKWKKEEWSIIQRKDWSAFSSRGL